MKVRRVFDLIDTKRSTSAFSVICFLMAALLSMGIAQAVVIDDRAGGAIYWGGKYVKIKPSARGDAIGKRTAVDQMEVIMENDIMTVKVTGPYFFNYAHNIKRTGEAQPGDLYISSRGWKVSGTPPYTEDVFEASEGWDYVVSLEKKKVYTLRFSDIIMTSALPSSSKYRAHQAWKGGYHDSIDDAAVTLTETGLTFVFSVRNMRLGSEIGLHWTMKCGNDIIEGSALIPPIAMAPALEPAAAAEIDADPVDILAASGPELPGSFIGASPSPVVVSDAFPAAVGGSAGYSLVGSAIIPFIPFGPVHHESDGPEGAPPGGPTEPPPGPNPSTPVPEPSIALLLFAGLSAIVIRKRLADQAGQ
jgi:hypothetical protein